MIYNEALANALDADANFVSIKINLPDTETIQNLSLEISDNGLGFDDIRFGKFSKLFDVEEQSHKRLGRLVYLCYFDKVIVDSIYDNGKKRRTFEFSDDFKGNSHKVDIETSPTGSSLHMVGFSGERLYKRNFIQPSYIQKMLLENFFLRLYKAKLGNQQIEIKIEANISGTHSEAFIKTSDMPQLSVMHLEHQLDLFNSIDLYYSVLRTDDSTKKPITAIAVDERCHKMDIIADENFPKGYEMIFLLMSESFYGVVDESRQNLTIPDYELGSIKKLFRDGISAVINEYFPQIAEENHNREENLKNTFPHLSGYFKTSDIGFSSQNDIIKNAQEQFFKDQREILSATHLSEEQYEKSLTLAAIALAEYIL